MKRLILFLLAGGLLASSDGSLLLAQAAPKLPSVSVRRLNAFTFKMLPGDFNGDGIVDLATLALRPNGSSRPVVALGHGDGTFGAGAEIADAFGFPLTVGDFNEDGRLDLIASLELGASPIHFLPGKGNGTFGTPVQIGGATEPTLKFAFAHDFDGDGNLDVGVGMIGDTDEGLVHIYAGHGNGTFAQLSARLSSGVDSTPNGGTVADLNGDGRPDVAVANTFAQSLSIFINQGAFNFTSSERPLGHPANGVTAADVTGDGKIDLVVAQSFDAEQTQVDGLVSVLPGNGNGTFGAARDFATGVDAFQIVTGDFNRDGVLDIATSNHSAVTAVGCGQFASLWDSLTILNGTGGGNFIRASDFSIGNQQDLDGLRHRDTSRTLFLADLNGDGHDDFLLHDGAVFITGSPDPNWAPKVDAGPDKTITGTRKVLLRATASDSDQDMVSWSWSSNAGIAIPNYPNPCITVPSDGTYTFTVTVDDRNGHRASDSVTYTFSSGGTTPQGPTVTILAPIAGATILADRTYMIRWDATAGSAPLQRSDVSFSLDDGASRFAILGCQNLGVLVESCPWTSLEPTEQGRIFVSVTDVLGRATTATSGRFAVRAGPPIPTIGEGWGHADVGAVGAAGTATFDGFVRDGHALTVSGSGADIWGTADEFHYAWKTIVGDFQIETRVASVSAVHAWTKAGLMIRENAIDPSSPHQSLFVTPGHGIAFQRRVLPGRDSVSLAGPALAAPVFLRLVRQRGTTSAWYRKREVDRWTLLAESSGMTSPTVDVGIAVSSHSDGAIAKAKFEGVYLAPVPAWGANSIGGAGAGVGETWGTLYTVQGGGTDIWGTSDSFGYMWVRMSGHATVTARILGVENTYPWAKAGVMIRESLAPDSKHAFALVTPGKGLALQYRSATGGTSVMAGQAAGAAPAWVRLSRFEGSSPGAIGGVQAQYSTDGVIWRSLGSVNFNMTHDVYVGIAVTSHNPSVQMDATVDGWRVE